MNIVFLNTFEKKTEDGVTQLAQVSIAEHKGEWHVHWNEEHESGKQLQVTWYEGLSWDELVSIFFIQFKQKMDEGYVPVINLDMQLGEQPSSKSKHAKILDFYSSLHPNEVIYEELRSWRRSQAIKESKAPYMLATNQMLRMISVFLPHTALELSNIPGCGRNKTNPYAHAMLAITTKEQRSTSFPLDWVIHQVDMAQFEQWISEQKKRRDFIEQERDSHKRKLIELMHQGTSIDDMQASLLISRRDLLLWLEELDREGYNVIPLADAELAFIPELWKEKAWELFETVGPRYLKPILLKLTEQENVQIDEIERAYDWLRLLRIKFLKK